MAEAAAAAYWALSEEEENAQGVLIVADMDQYEEVGAVVGEESHIPAAVFCLQSVPQGAAAAVDYIVDHTKREEVCTEEAALPVDTCQNPPAACLALGHILDLAARYLCDQFAP